MDKVKQKLKKRRRQEVMRQKRDKEKQLADEFNSYYREHGMRHNFSVKAVNHAYRTVERESTMSAMLAMTVVTLRAARKYLKFGAIRLWRLSAEITARIGWVGTGGRSISQLDEELQLDAHIKCSDFWLYSPNIPENVGLEEYQRRDAVLKTAPHVLPIFVHAVYCTLFKFPISRRSVRLERITRSICDSAKYGIEHNKIKEYREELASAGLYISEKGRFSSNKITEDEYKKGARRIAPIGG